MLALEMFNLFFKRVKKIVLPKRNRPVGKTEEVRICESGRFGGETSWILASTLPSVIDDGAGDSLVAVFADSSKYLSRIANIVAAGSNPQQARPAVENNRRTVACGFPTVVDEAAERLAIGYITPKDMLAGHQQEIQASGSGSWTRRRNSGRIAALP